MITVYFVRASLSYRHADDVAPHVKSNVSSMMIFVHLFWVLRYEQESAGVAHLKKLAKAGLSHVHLLPCFDFSSVDERKDYWKSVGKDFCDQYFMILSTEEFHVNSQY